MLSQLHVSSVCPLTQSCDFAVHAAHTLYSCGVSCLASPPQRQQQADQCSAGISSDCVNCRMQQLTMHLGWTARSLSQSCLQAIAEQLHYNTALGQLLVLNSTLSTDSPLSSSITAWDLKRGKKQARVACIQDPERTHDLCCFTPVSAHGCPAQLLAGAVRAGMPALRICPEPPSDRDPMI